MDYKSEAGIVGYSSLQAYGKEIVMSWTQKQPRKLPLSLDECYARSFKELDRMLGEDKGLLDKVWLTIKNSRLDSQLFLFVTARYAVAQNGIDDLAHGEVRDGGVHVMVHALHELLRLKGEKYTLDYLEHKVVLPLCKKIDRMLHGKERIR